MAYRPQLVLGGPALRVLSFLLLAACVGCAESTYQQAPDAAFTTQYPFDPEPADAGGIGDGEELGPNEDEDVPPGGSADDAGVTFDADREVVQDETALIRDDLLYTFDYYDGLTIIDVSEPAALRLLSHYPNGRLSATWMYITDDVVIALYHEVDRSAGDYRVPRSVIRMLDVADPARIEPLFELEVRGRISDSRLVGDVLYLIAEDHSCFGCPDIDLYSATIADRRLQWVDQLSVAASLAPPHGQASLYATPERLYVVRSGEEYVDNDSIDLSKVQVIDITDARGSLKLGARLDVPGWEPMLNEHQGVLRVLSVSFGDDMLFVSTFDQGGGQLGRAEVPLSTNALDARAVFDAARVFVAAGAERTTLVTLDLSDAAEPKATATTTMEREVVGLGVREQRLLVLSRVGEYIAEDGAELSLLDVSASDSLEELDRVVLANDSDGRATLDEGSRELQVDEATNLLAVTVSGATGCTWSRGSAELIEVKQDELVLRGSASTRHYVEPVGIHRGHLILSGERVLSYDLANPDAPRARSEAGVVGRLHAIAVAGEKLARLAANYSFDAVDLDAATSTALQSAIDSNAAVRQEDACAFLSNPYLFGDAQHAYLQYVKDSASRTLPPEWTSEVAIFDVSEEGAPVLLGTAVGPDSADLGLTTPLFADAPGTLLHREVLAFERQRHVGRPGEERHEIVGSQLEVIDLRAPSDPVWTTLELDGPEGSTGLYGRGTLIYSSHFEPMDDAGQVRFYVNRIDIEDPAEPKLLPKVNVPGALLGVLDEAHIVTLDQQDDAFFVRRVKLTEHSAAMVSSYDVPLELLPEDFVIDGQRLWMIASGEPFADRNRDVLVSIDALDGAPPRGRRLEVGTGNETLREVRPTEHGLLVLGARHAWRVHGESVIELGEHACEGRVELAGDSALCLTATTVQRIELAP